MSVSCKAVLAAINMALGTQYVALSVALNWYASPLAQAEDLTAEFLFKPGSKRPNTLLKHIIWNLVASGALSIEDGHAN